MTDPDLQVIADELEIRNLLARATQLADTVSDADLDTYLSLWTDDATWAVVSDGILPAQERRGRDQILEGVRERRSAGIQGPGTATRHALHTVAVRFESPDEAWATCYWHYYRETTSATPVLAGMGEYRNRLVRTPAGWRLARREIVPG
jgi:3-phenylpropionate/cinnamic acid dioxygenase small subunit